MNEAKTRKRLTDLIERYIAFCEYESYPQTEDEMLADYRDWLDRQ